MPPYSCSGSIHECSTTNGAIPVHFMLIGSLSLWLMDTDGAGGKGTWGKLIDTNIDSHIDRNDPNYDSGEVFLFLTSELFPY